MFPIVLVTFLVSTVFNVTNSVLLEYGNLSDNLNPKTDDECGSEQQLGGNFIFLRIKILQFLGLQQRICFIHWSEKRICSSSVSNTQGYYDSSFLGGP